MNAEQITEAFQDAFDHAMVFHGFTDYMRDYDVIVYIHPNASAGEEPLHLRYRFKHCVHASVSSSVPPRIWRDSTDERLVNDWQDHDLDGFVWGVRWQVMYPGAELVAKSKAADSWSRQLGQPFYEALIDASGHRISLVFADLVIDRVELGYTPFTVNADS